MKIDEYIKQDCIIIMPNIWKHSILKKANQENKWVRAKLYAIEEIKEKYLYKYHDHALYELVSSFGLEPSVCDMILPLLYDIEETTYQSPKLNKMVQMKKHLLKKGYLKKDPIFPIFLKNKNIIFYECQFVIDTDQKILQDIAKNNTVIEVHENRTKQEPIVVTKSDAMEEEVLSVCTVILTLLENGTPISAIKIYVGAEDYRSIIHRIFYQFGIPHNITKPSTLIQYDMAKYFMELLQEEEDFSTIASILRETYDIADPILLDVYNKMTTLMNIYQGCGDKDVQKKILLYKLHHTSVKKRSFIEAVEEIDGSMVEKGDTVFLLGFMTGVFPKLYKDDTYLSDIEKECLGLFTSSQKNQWEKERVYDWLSSTDHLYISYATQSYTKQYTQSSYIDYLTERTTVLEKEATYTYVNEYYNQYLLSKNLDDFTKYGQISEELKRLLGSYTPQYKTYTHQYLPIQEEKLHRYIQNNLVLSYSSLESFYKCSFRFYLQYILKIREDIEETSSIIFGNLVHQILCKIMKECPDIYEDIVSEEMENYFTGKATTVRDLFYQEKYKKEILKLIHILYQQRQRTLYKETYVEEAFQTTVEGKLHVTLIGYIDKVLTFEDDKHVYVMVIDYKTGTIDTNFGPVIHGLNMQLLLYLYLLQKNIPTFAFGGTYWQNVIKDVLPYAEGKTYQHGLLEAYRLDGYTTDHKDRISAIDRNLESSYIKGLKQKKDGEFYAYSKVLKDSQLKELLHITEACIQKAVHQIEKASFPINPKKIGYEKEITGCKFCPYYDICYREPDDIVIQKEYKNLEYLEGD